VRGEHIIDAATYSAVVIMVMLTTLITPPALKWSLNRRKSR
jgi:Kef-type K+ transport system membrane component KefB